MAWKNIALLFILNTLIINISFCSLSSLFYRVGEPLTINHISNCLEIIIPANNLRLYMNITNFNGIENIYYSNQHLTLDCNNFDFMTECSQQTSLCVGGIPDANTEYRYLLTQCTTTLHVYVKPMANTIGSLTINATYDKNNECISVIQDSWVGCAQMSLQDCKYGCGHYCISLECTNEFNETDFDEGVNVLRKIPKATLCVPDFRGQPAYQALCSNYGANTAVAAKNCTTFWSPYVPEPTAFKTVLFYIIIISLSLVALTVCFYRYKFTQSGEPPFDVPGCCPEILFPRKEYPVIDQLGGY